VLCTRFPTAVIVSVGDICDAALYWTLGAVAIASEAATVAAAFCILTASPVTVSEGVAVILPCATLTADPVAVIVGVIVLFAAALIAPIGVMSAKTFIVTARMTIRKKEADVVVVALIADAPLIVT
jgi:hypothetical protein